MSKLGIRFGWTPPPSFEFSVGPHAIAVPCPPINDADPTMTPTGAGKPKSDAPISPIVFCKKMNAVVIASRITNIRPPATRSDSLAFNPMVVKNMTRSSSRLDRSNTVSTPSHT